MAAHLPGAAGESVAGPAASEDVADLSFYRALFNDMPSGLAYCRVIYEAGRVVDWVHLAVNRVFESTLGLGELTGKRFSEIMPERVDAYAALLEMYERVVKTGTAERTEIYVDRLECWYEVLAYRQGPDEFVAVFDDVTEHKAAQVALAKSEARLNHALEKSHTGGWEIDIGDSIVHCTPQHDRILGLETRSADWTLDRLLDLVVAADREAVRKIVIEAGTHCRDFDTEFRLRRADGALRWIRLAGGPVAGPSGGPERVSGILQDITDRRLAEEATREVGRRLQITLASINDAVFTTDAAVELVDFNDAFASFHRFKSRDECYRSLAEYAGFLQFSAPAGQPVPVEEWPVRRALRGESGTNVEYSLLRKDTGDSWVGSFSFAPIRDIQGVVVGSVIVARDVTEAKRAEDALRASEERFLRAFRASPACQAITTVPAGKIVEVNAAHCALAGYDRKEMLGRTTTELGFWADTRERDEILEHILRDGMIRDREFRIKTRSGDTRTVVGSVDPIEWKGEPCVIAALTDITERKLVEAALRQSEERFRTLVETAPVAIFVRTGERFSYLNEAAVRLFGAAKPEDLLGRSVLDRYHPDDRDLVRERMRSQDALGESHFAADRVLLRVDGSPVPAIVSAVPLVFAGKKSSLVFTVDVTEQHQVLERLRESEERFRALADGAPDGIFIQAGPHIRYANQAMAAILGVESADQLVGQDGLEYVAAAYRTQVAERQHMQLATGAAAPSIDQEFVRVDGTHVPVETSAVPFSFGGEVAHLVFVRDHTERRRLDLERANLQEQLLQSQKMESIGQLAGGVAHDFNNILMVQKGYCELMKMNPASDPLLVEGLAEIERCTDRASDLTRQLLAFSRRQTLQPVVFDLNVLVGSTGEMLRRLIGEDVQLVTEPAPSPVMIKADRGQMEQVLTNLALNARDAMPHGGTLTIQVAVRELDEASSGFRLDLSPGSYAVLCVSDTGTGMDAATQRRIFEPFFTTKAEGKGTGLGLSTVYGIVRQSAGGIWVYSEPGEGATFKVYLPQVQDQTAATVEKEVQAVPGEGELVLLVEDEPALRQLAVLMIERLGYRVVETADGKEALAAVLDDGVRPDVVLTDVVIPGMSGPVLVDHLHETLPDLKVVYMSGYTDDAIAKRGIIESGTNFLQKPFTMSALAKMLRTALGAEEG